MGRLKTIGKKLIEMDKLADEIDRPLLEAQLKDIIRELNMQREELTMGGLVKETTFLSEERFVYKKGLLQEAEDDEVRADLFLLGLDGLYKDFLADYELITSNVRAGFPSAPLSEEEKERLRERGWREVLVKKYILTPEIPGTNSELSERYRDTYAAFFLLRDRLSRELFLFRFFVLGEWM